MFNDFLTKCENVETMNDLKGIVKVMEQNSLLPEAKFVYRSLMHNQFLLSSAEVEKNTYTAPLKRKVLSMREKSVKKL